jgi:hypothetical protein
LSPDVRVETEEIRNVLIADVLKREVLEGEKAETARKQIAKAANRMLRASKSADEPTPAPSIPSRLPTPETIG